MLISNSIISLSKFKRADQRDSWDHYVVVFVGSPFGLALALRIMRHHTTS